MLHHNRSGKSEFKEQQINLINHLAILSLVVTLAFWILNSLLSTPIPLNIFIGVFLISVITLLINLLGYNRTAAFFGLAAFDLAIYSIASSETTQTGLHIYLAMVAFAAFVIFGYEERFIALFFLIFSVSLYFACFFFDYSPLPERIFTEEQISYFFIINTIAFASTCSYLFYLVLRLNYKNEMTLTENAFRIREQNEQLIKTNQELDRFVYSASHDLRAPLSSMAGLITIAEATENPIEVREYLSMMRGRVKALDKFITDIINYSRNSRTELAREKVNVHQLISEIVEGLKFMEGVEEICFQIRVEPVTEIVTDPSRLKIVLNNLVANAIRYHDKNKTEKFIKIEVLPKENQVDVLVIDNGQGIHPDHIDKIFNMFYKTSSKAGGSGLGLYIAREAITKLNGSISVTSELGAGSTFSIVLPA